MSALFCLFLCFRSYSEKLEEYIPTFYKIRYILEELYAAVMWIISRLIISIDQLNEGLIFLFDLFLEARAEILENFLLIFWKIWRHQKDILKLTDLYLTVSPWRIIYCTISENGWREKKCVSHNWVAINLASRRTHFTQIVSTGMCGA